MNGVYWYGEIAGTSRCDLEYCFSLWTKKMFELLLKTPVYSLRTLKILRQPGGWGLSATGSRSQAWLDLTDAAHMEAHIELRAWLVCMIDALSLKGAKFELCSHWEETLPRPRTFKRRILKCQVLCGSTVPIGSLWCRPQHWRRKTLKLVTLYGTFSSGSSCYTEALTPMSSALATWGADSGPFVGVHSLQQRKL